MTPRSSRAYGACSVSVPGRSAAGTHHLPSVTSSRGLEEGRKLPQTIVGSSPASLSLPWNRHFQLPLEIGALCSCSWRKQPFERKTQGWQFLISSGKFRCLFRFLSEWLLTTEGQLRAGLWVFGMNPRTPESECLQRLLFARGFACEATGRCPLRS